MLFARRVDWRLVGAATLLVLATAWSGMFEVGAPYFEAPGLDIVTLANRYFYWDINDFHFVLIGAAAIFARRCFCFAAGAGCPSLQSCSGRLAPHRRGLRDRRKHGLRELLRQDDPGAAGTGWTRRRTART